MSTLKITDINVGDVVTFRRDLVLPSNLTTEQTRVIKEHGGTTYTVIGIAPVVGAPLYRVALDNELMVVVRCDYEVDDAISDDDDEIFLTIGPHIFLALPSDIVSAHEAGEDDEDDEESLDDDDLDGDEDNDED